MNDHDRSILYQALSQRDKTYDGRFVYAVRTTGIYCKPSCASRSALLKNIEFFETAQEAKRAGFRACRRCEPESQADAVSQKIQTACRLLAEGEERLDLRHLAAAVGLSPSHFQRTFTKHVGLSPARYFQAIRDRRFRARLKESGTVTDAVYDSGFGSHSRAYETSRSTLGMSPGSFRAKGQGETIAYGLTPSPLGWILVALTERGVCAVRLGDDPGALEQGLRTEFSLATLRRSEDNVESAMSRIVAFVAGSGPWPSLPLDLKTTVFQQRVSKALLEIRPGDKKSYSELAKIIGHPSAARAVARACATNPIAILVPCHRIVPADHKTLGGYRWGIDRKRKLLELESTSVDSAKANANTPPRLNPKLSAAI